uniref:Uncharacterized protein n=1 Tax=Arundo donax TaxID=35708 RepID=A0A0A8YT49_ARUDO
MLLTFRNKRIKPRRRLHCLANKRGH